ncbi:MAG: glucose-6-phosphate isomerase [Mycoplasmoidaceae bacterium]
MLSLNLKYLSKDIDLNQYCEKYQDRVAKLHDDINEKNVPGGEMLGWLDYPNMVTHDLIEEIQIYADNFRKRNINNILIISIGGSYTALRAAIDMCIPVFGREINVYYAQNLSSRYLNELKIMLEKEEFFIIVISKSGTTLEPAISLRVFYEVLLKRYGSVEAQNRIAAITSKDSGTLLQIANQYKWKTFYIPDDIGGRFSALTPISLLPLAMLGVEINYVLEGAKKAKKDTSSKLISKNLAYKYAVLRYGMYRNQKKKVEVFGSYEEDLFYFLEHLKQLFGESEGKEHKGLFPAISRYTTDLHSMGQFYQDGSPIFFETLLSVKNTYNDLKIKSLFNNLDNLDDFIKLSVADINNIALKSVKEAHLKAGNSTIEITLDKLGPEAFGYLYYWFSRVVTMSALLLKVNPFDQPGVEVYKKRMRENFKKKK